MSNTLRETRNGWSVRLRMGAIGGKEQRPWLPMPAMKETDAEDRRDRLQRLATEFVRAGKASVAEHRLRIVAEQPTLKAFEIAERAARRSLSEDPEAKPVGPRTFRDVAELWLRGDLHRSHPDDVPVKTDQSRASDRAMLAVFFPRLGHLPMQQITAEDTEAAKRLVPATVGYATRRNYLIRLRTVCKLAQHPLGLIDALPLRGKFVPPVRSDRDFWYLYPEEERLLLVCSQIPLEVRLLYGFIVRNGTRITETLRITWGHIDWDKGVVRLEKSWTKSRRGRVWKLDPDVLRALRRRWQDIGKPKTGLIFTGSSGEANTRLGIQRRFTGDLRAAGITREELLVSTKDTRRLRVHDLRATFVTLARKVGRRMADGVEVIMTDRWIMDRTGHETLGVLGKYERMVRHAAELDLGWFASLDEMLFPTIGPAVAKATMDQEMDQNSPTSIKKASANSSSWTASGSSAPRKQPNPAAASCSNGTGQRLGPSPEGGVDQKIESGVSAAATSPGLSEATLKRLLDLATRSREWGVVRELSVALEALEQGRVPNVTRLDDRRRGK